MKLSQNLERLAPWRKVDHLAHIAFMYVVNKVAALCQGGKSGNSAYLKVNIHNHT